MNIIFDATGSQVASVNEYDVAPSTAIALGQVVSLALGKVILGTSAMTTAILGVPQEAHTGAGDALNIRSNGTKIKILDAPNSIFESSAPLVTATSGTATTVLVDGLKTIYADNDFVGGYLKLITKAPSSTITDSINTIYPITGSTTLAGTFTVSTVTGGVTAGDIFAIFPPIGFIKGNLDSTVSKLVLTATAAIPFQVYGLDTDRNMVQLMATLHENGNKKA